MSTNESDHAGAWQLVVSTSEVDAGTVAEFEQEIDVAVQHCIDRTGPSGRPILVVDLGWVTFLDSAGVSVLQQATDRLEANGGAIRLCNANGAIHLLLDGTGRWGKVHSTSTSTAPTPLLTVSEVRSTVAQKPVEP